MFKPTDVENIILRVWDQNLRKNGTLSNMESYWQNTNIVLSLCFLNLCLQAIKIGHLLIS